MQDNTFATIDTSALETITGGIRPNDGDGSGSGTSHPLANFGLGGLIKKGIQKGAKKGAIGLIGVTGIIGLGNGPEGGLIPEPIKLPGLTPPTSIGQKK